MPVTQTQFLANVRSFMDAEQSTRWSDALILAVAGLVANDEWAHLLNANRFYNFATISVTTDSQGRIPLSQLSTGTGDTAQNFYRVLAGPTDGNILWRETDFDYVPLGAQTNYQNPYEYLYYIAGGDNTTGFLQLLPVQAGLALTVGINWRPVTIDQLAGGGSNINFPAGYEWIPTWVTAATCLLKGGAEAGAAQVLYSLADDARKTMLGDLGRKTTRPTLARYQDSPAAWGG